VSNHLIERLAEERASAWEQAKAILDTASEEGRDLSAEESATFDKINADLDTKDARIKSIIEAEERSQAIAESRSRLGVPTNLGGEAQPEIDVDDMTIRRLLNGEIRNATFEKRAVTKSSATMVPSSVYDRIVEHLVQANVVRGVATVLTTQAGESLAVPKSTAFSTASIVGEGSQASASDPTLGTTTLGAYKYVTLVQLSNELAQDATVDVAGFLARQAGIAIGVAPWPHDNWRWFVEALRHRDPFVRWCNRWNRSHWRIHRRQPHRPPLLGRSGLHRPAWKRLDVEQHGDVSGSQVEGLAEPLPV